MFDFFVSPEGQGDLQSLPVNALGQVSGRIRSWLDAAPDAEALLENSSALEAGLAAAQSVGNDDLRERVADALARLQDAPEVVRATELATRGELLHLYIDAMLLTGREQFGAGAQRLIRDLTQAYVAEEGYFKSGDAVETAANAALADAFYYAWRILDDAELRAAAGSILSWVSSAFNPDRGLAQHLTSSGAEDPSQEPAAYAVALEMFMTACETTGRRTYIGRACTVADFLIEGLDSARFQVTMQGAVNLGRALVRLEQFTGIHSYAKRAVELLAPFASSFNQEGIGAAHYALAVEEATSFPLHIAVIGDPEGEAAQSLWRVALRVYASSRAVELLDPARDSSRIQALGYAPPSQGAQAFVCKGAVCLPPVRTIRDLLAAVGPARSRQGVSSQ